MISPNILYQIGKQMQEDYLREAERQRMVAMYAVKRPRKDSAILSKVAAAIEHLRGPKVQPDSQPGLLNSCS